MSPLWAAVVVAAAGFVLTLAVNLLIVGMLYGKLRADVTNLQESRTELATKEQVNDLGRQVAEIKGMFRMTLKVEHEAKVSP